jgi:L-aminopeptidase/D-esterase-like protein
VRAATEVVKAHVAVKPATTVLCKIAVQYKQLLTYAHQAGSGEQQVASLDLAHAVHVHHANAVPFVVQTLVFAVDVEEHV